MFNTISNLSRTADKYGDIHFISFLGATLSRLAYQDDNKFLENDKITKYYISQDYYKIQTNDTRLIDENKIIHEE